MCLFTLALGGAANTDSEMIRFLEIQKQDFNKEDRYGYALPLKSYAFFLLELFY